MTDEALSALAFSLFVLSLAAVIGLVYVEVFAPYLLEVML